MVTKRQQIQEEAANTVSPILEEIGVELVEAHFARSGRDQVLRLYVDRPDGITVDELQEASRLVEKVLEVHEIIEGRYRLEVSSPGLDRPWKRMEDFQKNIGGRVGLTLFTPLPDGRRQVKGTLTAAGEGEITLDLGEDGELTVPFENVSAAKPDIDWRLLLKQPAGAARKGSGRRRIT